MTTCNSAVVSNIQRFSLDDGPGIRTTIFLKGCNLKCKWCHNPECIEDSSEIEFFITKCTACGRCSQACAYHAKIDGTGKMDRTLCRRCGQCIDVCYNEALELVGEEKTVDDLMKIIRKDIPYYRESKGGVTISGGEPILQVAFLEAILKACKAEGLHTAVDTAGCVSGDYFRKIYRDVDLFLFDIKMLDPVKHMKYTGVDNGVILSNLNLLHELGVGVHVRIPIIKGINDDLEELRQIAEMVSGMKNIHRVKLLPYHSYGEAKYQALELKYENFKDAVPEKEFMEKAKSLFTDKGMELE